MSWQMGMMVALLAAVGSLASYIRRIYAEYGKILSREEQDNLDSWEEEVEPHLGLDRDHAALCATLLEQLALSLIALGFGATLFDRAPQMGRPSAVEVAQAVLGLVLVNLFANQLVPAFLFNRTEGKWAADLLWPIRILLWFMTPITVPIRFFFSVVALAEEPTADEEENSANVEALIEAGEEEGILEQSDSDLVRSAVEFGDKLVRELMTPRPQVFAVEGSTTLEGFLELLNDHAYSRVPVFSGSIDNMTGLAFAHDLLQVTDADAHTRTVASLAREVEFVPETKRGYELLREMQREQQHLRVVIDEYGGVAGVVTIEDLLEQIVGEIRDEHEESELIEEPQREPAGSWLAPGGFSVDRLKELFGEPVELGEAFEATTLGGLVSELMGRIPLAGEVVVVQGPSLRLEVLDATDRRVERVRIFPPVASKDERD